MDAREGENLVSVAFANDRAEGDMIQGLLGSAGIPSFLQHVGVDGPQLGIGLLNPGGGSQMMVRSDLGLVVGAMMLAFGVFLLLRMV